MKLLHCPTPFPNESLFNYIYRLAQKNVCPISWIYKKIKFGLANNKFAINNISGARSIELLSELSALSLDSIRKMTIDRYMSKERNYSYDYINLEHSKYCPICLKEKHYHRLYWNIELIKICPVHNVILHDKCHSCGKLITTEEVIYGKCSCSAILKESIVSYCEDRHIIKFQNELLYNLGVTINDDTVYELNFKNTLFIDSLNSIINYIEENKTNLNRSNVILEKSRPFTETLYSFYLLQAIQSDLSKNLPLLFDDINDILHYELNQDNDELESREPRINSSPICMRYEFYQFRFFNTDSEVFKDCLFKYIIDNYTYDFFKKRLSSFIVNGRAIDIKYVSYIFRFDRSTLLKNFDIVIDNGIKYVDLKQIVDYVRTQLEKAKKAHAYNVQLDDMTTFSEAYSIFGRLGFSEIELVDISNSYNIDKYLDVLDRAIGMDMIKIPRKQFFTILLKKALEKLEGN